LQTTLQRNPRSSLEQLGQMDDASFFTLSGERVAGVLIALATAIGVGAGRDELPFELGFELISGLVAQNDLREEY
jgi:hypothetical protein